MFEFNFNPVGRGNNGVISCPAEGGAQWGPKRAKVMRRSVVNNLWKSSQKFSLPTVAQIQLPIRHLPQTTNFCKEPLPELPCENLRFSSGARP
jgi:hypothetical protein